MKCLVFWNSTVQYNKYADSLQKSWVYNHTLSFDICRLDINQWILINYENKCTLLYFWLQNNLKIIFNSSTCSICKFMLLFLYLKQKLAFVLYNKYKWGNLDNENKMNNSSTNRANLICRWLINSVQDAIHCPGSGVDNGAMWSY